VGWDLDKMLKEIDDYFDNVTKEEFEEALKKAGHGLIESASKSGYRLAKPDEIK
jgi:hypothetical protein